MPRRFIMTFLVCASGFGSRNLLFAARRVLRLGMSSSSSRSLAARVILSRGGDERMGYDRGFLKVLRKSSIGIGRHRCRCLRILLMAMNVQGGKSKAITK
jgi:hypothetical protein